MIANPRMLATCRNGSLRLRRLRHGGLTPETFWRRHETSTSLSGLLLFGQHGLVSLGTPVFLGLHPQLGCCRCRSSAPRLALPICPFIWCDSITPALALSGDGTDCRPPFCHRAGSLLFPTLLASLCHFTLFLFVLTVEHDDVRVVRVLLKDVLILTRSRRLMRMVILANINAILGATTLWPG